MFSEDLSWATAKSQTLDEKVNNGETFKRLMKPFIYWTPYHYSYSQLEEINIHSDLGKSQG